MNEAAQMLFLMMAGHAYADFALQDPWHSAVKYPGNAYNYPWPVALLCHSLIHGGIVALITGYWWLGVLETAAHGAIDWGKAKSWYGATADQLAHVACKIVWVATAVALH